MRYLTADQKRVLGHLGFRVLKVKADYYSPCLSDPRDHILVEIRENKLSCYTMHGRFGSLAFTLPGDVSGEEFLAELRKVRDSVAECVVEGYLDSTDLQWVLRNDRQLAEVCNEALTSGGGLPHGDRRTGHCSR